eukprot:TRINITY_DN5234_c3_g1_i2.p1 TRINITY_DN5234_c3_g1~~TRINITY_DN5234_c3_g1_i2.p1  ORF type:complete len:507 (-),score=71.93 TRINITY_DN5234_c3_g1_i2:68-1588(-)
MHEKLVNSNNHTDITFVLPNDQRVTAHSFIVEVRCPKILTTNITEKKKGKYYIASTNYLSQQELLLVLHYVYSGALPITDKPHVVRVLMSLCKCAEVYEMDGLLNEACKLLWAALDTKNVTRGAKMAAELNTVKGAVCCELWKVVHWTKEKPFELAEPSPAQIKEAQVKSSKLFKPYAVDPSWYTHWELILKQMNSPDFLIVNNDETEEGACHRCVLEGHSPQLAELVNKSDGEYFSSLSAIAIEVLLRWLYFYSPCTDYNVAAEILPFAYEFGISSLASECEEMLSDCVDETTVFWILQIIVTTNYHTKSKLKIQCLEFIIENLPFVDFQVLREMPAVVAQEVIKAIQKSVGVQWVPDRILSASGNSASSNTQSKSLIPPTPSAAPPATPSPGASPVLPREEALAPSSAHKTGSSSPRSTSGALSDTSADPATSGSSTKPMEPKPADSDSTDSMGRSSEESFHIPKFMPDPQLRERREVNPTSPPQYKKKKKISGVKDLDDLFGF